MSSTPALAGSVEIRVTPLSSSISAPDEARGTKKSRKELNHGIKVKICNIPNAMRNRNINRFNLTDEIISVSVITLAKK